MKYSITELFKAVSNRVAKTFQRKEAHMSVIDKLQLRFLKPGKEVNKYTIFGHTVYFPFPSYWFRHSYKELFEEEVYKFTSETASPLIIDCGSNIGLSIIYFKRLYPECKIIAFEPDDKIFGLAQKNLSSFGFNNINLINKGVWHSATVLKFESTGTMSGSILKDTSTADKVIEITTVRLRDYLNRPVSFLKIDIEGAEIPVLEDCRDLLYNVQNLFVEYHCYPGQPLELTKLLDIVQQSGFRYYIRQASENMQFPFVEKHGKYCDVQLNIFCFRD